VATLAPSALASATVIVSAQSFNASCGREATQGVFVYRCNRSCCAPKRLMLSFVKAFVDQI
jgi:hypothetical protein